MVAEQCDAIDTSCGNCGHNYVQHNPVYPNKSGLYRPCDRELCFCPNFTYRSDAAKNVLDLPPFETEEQVDTEGHPLVDHIMVNGKSYSAATIEFVLDNLPTLQHLLEENVAPKLIIKEVFDEVNKRLITDYAPSPAYVPNSEEKIGIPAVCYCGHTVYEHNLMDAQGRQECQYANCPCESIRVPYQVVEPIRVVSEEAPELLNTNIPIVPKEEDGVIHPSHYQGKGPEAWAIARHLSFNLGSALKYIYRAGNKMGEHPDKDLAKAINYIEDERKLLRGEYDNAE